MITSPTEIYPLSLHDALPISAWWPMFWKAATSAGAVRDSGTAGRAGGWRRRSQLFWGAGVNDPRLGLKPQADRKSTRLNSSHLVISYAVFCLKKKKH